MILLQELQLMLALYNDILMNNYLNQCKGNHTLYSRLGSCCLNKGQGLSLLD